MRCVCVIHAERCFFFKINTGVPVDPHSVYALDFPSTHLTTPSYVSPFPYSMPTPHSARATSRSLVCGRSTTIQRDLVRDIANRLQLNPEFTPADRAVRNALFDPTCCFVTGKLIKLGATGDHLYEVRNYYRVTGRYGVAAQWNRLPVHHSVNTKYKVFEIKLSSKSTVKRNVGHETLTNEEYEACTPKQRFVYDLLQHWKAYVGYRRAHLSYALPRATSERMNEAVRRALRMIDEEAAAVADEYRARVERGEPEEGEDAEEAAAGEVEVGEVEDVTDATPTHPAAGNSTPQPPPLPPSTPPPQPKCRTRASPNPPAPPPTPPTPPQQPTDALPPHDPAQWRIETRIRQTGNSAGKRDTYYHHVFTGKLCRSTPETRRYQQQARDSVVTPSPPPRPTLVAPTRAVVSPSPVRAPAVRAVVPHQAVAVWVAAVVAGAVARVASSPWAAARALFASTCPRRTAKMSSTSC